MVEVVISGTGTYVPPSKLDNEQLVKAYNAYVDDYNTTHADAIAAGEKPAKQHSSAEFIEKASGIKSRHLIDAEGVADLSRMKSRLPEGAHGDQENPSFQAQMGIAAGRAAMDAAGVTADEIDFVICSSASPQRYFPAMGIEIQHFLGIKQGSAIDMVMGCSSATTALIAAYNAIKAGTAKRVLMVNPEIFSSMVNYKDRDSHFIFGDIAVAAVLEAKDLAKSDNVWEVFDVMSETYFSSNIRSHFGPMTRLDDDSLNRDDMFFVQQGRKVFKELLPLVTDFLGRQMARNHITISDMRRMWLHQANINMNNFAAKKLLDRDPTPDEAPIVLDKYGNIAGAGSLVSFHENNADLNTGDMGVICSFGAGYSIGSLFVRKL